MAQMAKQARWHIFILGFWVVVEGLGLGGLSLGLGFKDWGFGKI